MKIMKPSWWDHPFLPVGGIPTMEQRTLEASTSVPWPPSKPWRHPNNPCLRDRGRPAPNQNKTGSRSPCWVFPISIELLISWCTRHGWQCWRAWSSEIDQFRVFLVLVVFWKSLLTPISNFHLTDHAVATEDVFFLSGELSHSKIVSLVRYWAIHTR